MTLSQAEELKKKISSFLLSESLPNTDCHVTNLLIGPRDEYLSKDFIKIIECANYDQDKAIDVFRNQYHNADKTKYEKIEKMDWGIIGVITAGYDFESKDCEKSETNHLYFCWIDVLVKKEKGEILEKYDASLSSIFPAQL